MIAYSGNKMEAEWDFSLFGLSFTDENLHCVASGVVRSHAAAHFRRIFQRLHGAMGSQQSQPRGLQPLHRRRTGSARTTARARDDGIQEIADPPRYRHLRWDQSFIAQLRRAVGINSFGSIVRVRELVKRVTL